jgi:hypothetical protein
LTESPIREVDGSTAEPPAARRTPRPAGIAVCSSYRPIGYMLKHWVKLTLLLRVPGAPLDNNICERALKKAILHRKNALFYKTLNGAHVGDVFMSLSHSVELNRENAFEYLVAL